MVLYYIKKVRFLLLAVLAMSASSLGYAASFDCSLARSTLEILICADKDLSQLDGEVGESYGFLRTSITDKQKNHVLVSSQKDFLKKRLEVCPIPYKNNISSAESQKIIECIKGQYSLRLAKLNELKKTLWAEGEENAKDGVAPLAKEPESPSAIASNEIKDKAEALPQCDHSMFAKSYFVAACVFWGQQEGGQNNLLSDSQKKMNAARDDLKCSPESLSRIQQSAEIAAHKIISSNTISSLMDFNDALEMECSRTASVALK